MERISKDKFDKIYYLSIIYFYKFIYTYIYIFILPVLETVKSKYIYI